MFVMFDAAESKCQGRESLLFHYGVPLWMPGSYYDKQMGVISVIFLQATGLTWREERLSKLEAVSHLKETSRSRDISPNADRETLQLIPQKALEIVSDFVSGMQDGRKRIDTKPRFVCR